MASRITSSGLLGSVTNAHSLERGDVDGGIARHEAGVVAAKDVGTLLAVSVTHRATKVKEKYFRNKHFFTFV
jgi:hypothetical protein